MILFFYGEETYRSSQNVAQLKKSFLAKNPTGGGLVVFDCEEMCNIMQITQSFGEQNLFAQKKLIIIKNIFSYTKAPEQNQIIDALQFDTDDIIVFFEEGKVRKNASLFKWLQNNAQKVQENLILEGYALEKWIIDIVKDNNKNITGDAVKELILFVGNDLWQLTQEIEKLICYAIGEEIVVGDVHNIVHGRVDADMFQMIEAISLSDKSTALFLLKKQLASGDDPFHIFSMYAYQVRILLKVGGILQDNISDKNVIAKALKLHPFVVQKSIGMSQRLSYKKIMSMHKSLVVFDYDIKQGNRDVKSALDLFIINA